MTDRLEVPAKTAPCRAACPADVDVPRYVRLVRDGDFDAALATVREKMPFAAVCGYACFAPCEARCARRQIDGEPVAIRLLKRVAADLAAPAADLAARPAPSGRRVAVVGSGPAGLTAAWLLAGRGHAVEVFEAASAAGGMLRWGIPGYRLPNEVVDREIDAIVGAGVSIVTGARVGAPADLLADGRDAVLVATGAWNPVRLGFTGEDGERVLDGIGFLKRAAAGEPVALGRRVVVVGGGNTAIDAARTAIRLGAEVTLLYRRTRIAMPASGEEIAEAEEEGLAFVFHAAPVGFSAGRLACVRLAPRDGAEGRGATLEPVEGGEFSIDCDTLVVAVGQTADADTLGLAVARAGTAAVDGDGATPVPGVFAAGDVVRGPSTIVDAIADGRRAGEAIDRFLRDNRAEDRTTAVCDDDGVDAVDLRRPRQVAGKTPAEERRRDFGLVEAGFDAGTARAEAERCLSCQIRSFEVEVAADLCKGCGYCAEICTMEVFARSETFNAQGYRPEVAVHPEHCVGCLKCFAVCPDFAVSVGGLA